MLIVSRRKRTWHMRIEGSNPLPAPQLFIARAAPDAGQEFELCYPFVSTEAVTCEGFVRMTTAVLYDWRMETKYKLVPDKPGPTPQTPDGGGKKLWVRAGEPVRYVGVA